MWLRTDRLVDNRKISKKPQMEPIPQHLNNLAHRLSQFKTFGDITTIPRWTKSRCENQYTYSSKASNQYGKTGEI
jgi:hypothetical protein